MATSMNPVELYHDPSLDGLIDMPENIQRRNRRRSSGSDRRPVMDNIHPQTRMPFAPEVPRGPPISYRGPMQGDPDLQRSFSQRAKGRPYAKEAYADEENYQLQNRPPARQSYYDPAVEEQYHPPRPLEKQRMHHNPQQQQYDLMRSPEQPIETRNQQTAAMPTDRSIPGGRHSSSQTRSRRTSDSRPRPEQPAPVNTRANAVQENHRIVDEREQERDWAADRSPLQKLEVTLNDISKEEKRARVQEAEMLLRESKVARQPVAVNESDRAQPTVARPNQTATRDNVENLAQQPTIEDAGLVRNLSNTQRNRLQQSTVIDTRKPDPRRLSGEGHRGFDYTSNQASLKADPVQPNAARVVSDGGRPRQTSGPQVTGSRYRRKDDDYDMQRSVSDAQPDTNRMTVANTVPSNITRAVSMQNHQPQPQFAEDVERHPPEHVERDRNASHKATLAKLTGNGGVPVAARTGSRKLQKAPPQSIDQHKLRRSDVPVDHVQAMPAQAIVGRKVDSGDRQTQRQVENHPQRLHTPVGLGVQGPSHTSSPQSPQNQMDAVRQRQRKSSVSFNEATNRRPVDEWKGAGIARLALADIATPATDDKEKDKAWWESQNSAQSGKRRKKTSSGAKTGLPNIVPIDDRVAEFNPRLYLRCGPLLRYTGMRRTTPNLGGSAPESEFWRGSVMIVTQDSHSSYSTPPVLRLFSRPTSLLPPPPAEIVGEVAPEYVDPLAGLTKVSRTGRSLYVRPVDHLEEGKDLSLIENDDGLFESSPSPLDIGGGKDATTALSNKRTSDRDGEHAGRVQEVQGARLYADPDRDVTFWRFNIEVELGSEQQHIAYRINNGAATGFWVPAQGQTMHMMFHSCNGFSTSVNADDFSGPDPLWRDVLNVHQTRPFHVMIGGGDQIYNDRVSLETHHFGEWTRIRNPSHKHHAPFTPDMKEELETFYLNRYAMWFSQGLFGMANSQIPMVNIWDDHDIIDGFGSYPDHFMKTPVFSGLGNIAYKYYMLFQHQTVSSETTVHEPSWILGSEPGPYIHQLSRSVFMHMGRHVAFLGLDCRTERTRKKILNKRTLENVLERCRKEIVEGETKHLILLLGVPIAYPRLVFLENVLTSKAMDPIKALGRTGLFKGGLLNRFDGGVEILDDLNDHWTASYHKTERNYLIEDLQDLAAEKSVRITILGGDVHLAAVGQFRSNPKLRIPKDRDHRYMPNVVSSAIVNTPPPTMMADMINKRNKVHHLDRYTDEDMIPMFTHDVDHKKRNNKHLLPRRNWCSLREYIPGSTPPPTPPEMSDMSQSEAEYEEGQEEYPKRRRSFSRDSMNPRSLFRRISSRNAPPSAYRDNRNYQNGQNGQFRSASFDGGRPGHNAPFSQDANYSGSQANSIDSQGQNRRASSLDNPRVRGSVRPGIFRRPTNLSEKAARKGDVPAVDAEGNEFDVNDHVNLDGGLDIVLNVECDQKDPAGITTPYRLLVPALWYDGSSDREKLDEDSEDDRRRPGLFNRMGVGRRRNDNTAQNQGAGNWGQEMSESESYSGSDTENQRKPPRKRFSLFGSRRRRREEEEEWSGSESDPETPTAQQQFGHVNHQNNSHHGHAPGQVNHHQSSHAPHTHDRLYDTSNRPPQPGLRPGHGQNRRSLIIKSPTTNSSPHQPRQQYSQHNQPLPRSDDENYPRAQPQQNTAQTQPSYHSNSSTYVQQPGFNSPPNASGTTTRTNGDVPQRRLSKQDRVLGIGLASSGQDTYPNPDQSSHHHHSHHQHQPHSQPQIQSQTQNQHLQGPPQQRVLQGNGIIRSHYSNNPTSPRGQGNTGGRRQQQQQQYEDDDGQMQQGYGGYDGIEAYQEPKPKRGFSLRKARDWLDGRQDSSYY